MSDAPRPRGLGTAHGKVILLGEHAVVYGRPALAAGLGLGARARAVLDDATTLAIAPWGVTVRADAASTDPLGRALSALLDAMGARDRVRIEAEVHVPSGAGLGSSAALGVAVMRAIDDLAGVARVDEDAFACSLAWERVFHGNPSGVDGRMALSGGAGLFVRGAPLERVVPRRPLHLVVGDSAEPSSTHETVASVARQHARDPARLDQTFDAIASLVRNGRLAVDAGDVRALGQLFDMNQSLLAGMLLSTATLEDMIAAARAAGAAGAKLTGGGGGGCMIALAHGPDDAAAIRAAIEALGKRAFVTTVGGTE